jgi:excinuclease ABC subunit C
MGLDIPLFGMVKDDFHKTRALTDGDGEIGIATEQAVYTFVYKIQEEAHRFAYRASQGAKRKTLKHSSLEGIPGIGPKKAQRLLRSFGSLRALKAASREELIRIEGISERDAVSILTYFEKKTEKKK